MHSMGNLLDPTLCACGGEAWFVLAQRHQHELCGEGQLNAQDGIAPIHAADQRLLKKDRESRARRGHPLDASHRSGASRSRLGA